MNAMFLIKDKAKIESLAALSIAAVLLFLQKIIKVEGGLDVRGQLIFCFLVFLIFPFLTIHFIFKRKIAKYNLRFFPSLGKKELVLAGILLALFIAPVVFIVLNLDWDWFFLVSDWILAGHGVFIFIEFVVLPIIIFCKEFFFRGFLLESLRRGFGVFWAVIIVSLAFVAYSYFLDRELIGLRLLLAVYLNLILSLIVLFSRSVFVSTVIFWAYVTALDFLVLSKVGQMIGG